MLAYLIRRLAISAITLAGVAVIAFFLVRVVPGSAAIAQLGARATPERIARIEARHGLDRPAYVRFGEWLAGVTRGDLGESSYYGRPVTAVVSEHFPVTLELAALALGVATLVGIPLGVLAAVRQHRASDYAAMGFGVLGVSVPNFWLATMLILVFAYYLRWLPAGGTPPGLLEQPLANLRFMAMPTIALAAAVTAVIVRMTRSSMLEVLGSDYVRTAIAKGLAPRRVIFKHALRNATVPVLTIIGIQAGYLLGGSIVIEMVFNLHGIGWLAYTAATERDWLLLQAVILLIATGFIVINLAVDLTYGLLDPRMRKTGT